MPTKNQLTSELQALLHDFLIAKTKGVAYPRLARAHGYVDGYMKALLETGIFTKKELLAIVAEQRTAVHGPALLEQTPVPSAEFAA
jgi:hypothetical protein